MIDLNWRPRCLQVIRDVRTNPFIEHWALLFNGNFVTLIGLGRMWDPRAANDNG